MTENAADLDGLLARLAEDRRDDPEDHPGSERLSAYQAGELSPEEDDDIQEHLANCRLCAGRLQDLQRFLDPPPEDRPREGVADFETEVEWRKLRHKVTARPGWARRFFGSAKTAYGVAAMLAVAVVGLSLDFRRGGSLELNPISVYVPSQVGIRGAEPRTRITISRQGKSLTLRLDASRASSPRYRLVVLSARKQKVISRDGLLKQDSEFLFKVNPHDLEPGKYDIQVFGLGGGNPNLVGYYEVEIVRG